MKKIIVLLFVIIAVNLFSNDIIRFKELKDAITKLSINSEELKIFLDKIFNKKLDKETGWILSIKNNDAATDIVYVEMDIPNKNFSLNKPDLYFIIDKKISKKLSEYQMIYFNAKINNYDFDKRLFKIENVYLHGITR